MLLTGPLPARRHRNCSRIGCSVSSLWYTLSGTVFACRMLFIYAVKSKITTLMPAEKHRTRCWPSSHKRVGQRDAYLDVQPSSFEALAVYVCDRLNVGPDARSPGGNSGCSTERRISVASFPFAYQLISCRLRCTGRWMAAGWDEWRASSDYWSDPWLNWVSLCTWRTQFIASIYSLRMHSACVSEKKHSSLLVHFQFMHIRLHYYIIGALLL